MLHWLFAGREKSKSEEEKYKKNESNMVIWVIGYNNDNNNNKNKKVNNRKGIKKVMLRIKLNNYWLAWNRLFIR